MAQPWTQRFSHADAAPSIMVAWFNDLRLSDSDVKKARRWLVITGILGILAGVAAIIVPPVATLTITLFIGWILVFSGVVMAVHSWTLRAAGRTWERALQALLALVIGVYMVLFPGSGALSLTLLLVIWFAGSGVLQLIAARRLRGLPGAGWLVFGGVLGIVLAALIAMDLPSSAEWAIGLLVGINLVFWGVRALVAASLLKRVVAD
ncbi:MAG: hypothetical protein QOK16_1076 [Solirubrobacteraceae bacterium]|jgi:uncharacterized membrane protein HdeD (DUF308 family)|nr:hypothetical protein [Solirubrobacteraceae bacterium]MEA2186065.1 hypothetical protein [Solirubrobacteraceae bacterium]